MLRTLIKYEQMLFTSPDKAHIHNIYIDVAGQSDMEIEKRKDKKKNGKSNSFLSFRLLAFHLRVTQIIYLFRNDCIKKNHIVNVKAI